MTAQNAQQVEQAQAKKTGIGIGSEDFQMPDLVDIQSSSQVAGEMTAGELQEAYEAAAALDFSDPVKAMEFGLADQEYASKVTRQFMEHIKGAGLEQIGEIARGQNEKMQELNIGELKPSVLGAFCAKIFPKAQVKKVEQFLEKHRSLSEIIDEGEQAQASERVKLSTLQERMREKVNENNLTYQRLTKTIAQAELRYAADKIKVAEYKERNKDSQSQAKVREINLMDQALSMEARRINSLKATRQETLNALTVMDLQVQRIHSQMQMIDEQRVFNRMVWDNSVMMAATDKQMRNAVNSITYNREAAEKMMKKRTEGISETLQKVIGEEKAGVVNAAVLEYAAKELMRMNRTIIDGNKEIRDQMQAADNIIKRLDEEVKGVMRHAAAMSQEDLAKLDTFLKKVDGNGQPANTDQPAGAGGAA